MRFCYFADSFLRGNKLMMAFSGQYHGADVIPTPHAVRVELDPGIKLFFVHPEVCLV